MQLKFRWLLPVGHVIIDCFLLLAMIAYSNRVFQREQSVIYPATPTRVALFLQESGLVEWNPKTIPPSGPFMLIMSGNPVAGFIADILRPKASFVSPKQSWDHIWFLLLEAIAFPCWYLIGLWIDAGHSGLEE